MADPSAVADDLDALARSIRDDVPDALGDQMERSLDRMRADTPRDRGVTAESYVHEVDDGGRVHRGYSNAVDKRGRSIATILEFGINDRNPDAIVERERARAATDLPAAVASSVKMST